jgi:hypothetical protein
MFKHCLEIKTDIFQSGIFEFFDGTGCNSVEKLAYVSHSYCSLSAAVTEAVRLQHTEFAKQPLTDLSQPIQHQLICD